MIFDIQEKVHVLLTYQNGKSFGEEMEIEKKNLSYKSCMATFLHYLVIAMFSEFL